MGDKLACPRGQQCLEQPVVAHPLCGGHLWQAQLARPGACHAQLPSLPASPAAPAPPEQESPRRVSEGGKREQEQPRAPGHSSGQGWVPRLPPMCPRAPGPRGQHGPLSPAQCWWPCVPGCWHSAPLQLPHSTPGWIPQTQQALLGSASTLQHCSLGHGVSAAALQLPFNCTRNRTHCTTLANC